MGFSGIIFVVRRYLLAVAGALVGDRESSVGRGEGDVGGLHHLSNVARGDESREAYCQCGGGGANSPLF